MEDILGFYSALSPIFDEEPGAVERRIAFHEPCHHIPHRIFFLR
jgi:hypothetical protein